jgi:hypothetical protein
MNSEPKSIFTSQKDFGSQASQEQISPQLSSLAASAPTIPPAPILLDSVDREADLPGKEEDVNAPQTVATIRSRENSKELDIGAEPSTTPFNAPTQRQPPSPTIEHFSFRKPDRPVTHAQSFAVPKAAQASKHPRSEDHGTRPLSIERASKRTRPKLKARHTLDPDSFQAAAALIGQRLPGTPPSPLFFSSHNPRQRPLLPSNFSSSAAAATMLNKARDELGGVTTLKLARGSISSVSSPPRTNAPGSVAALDRGIFDRSSEPGSPDSKNKTNSGLQLLSTVGIIELLEQDERPTFIIDVANSANFMPGPLQLVFTNPSLRAYESVLEMITGKIDLDSPGIGVTTDFPEFKSWVLSFVKNGESLDICLPSFLYGGITWTCSTLRKRLRLISGSPNAITVATGSGSSNGALSSSSIISERARSTARGSYAPSPLAGPSEAADYFGDAVPPRLSTEIQFPRRHIETLGESGDVEVPQQAMVGTQIEAITGDMVQTRCPENSSFDWTRLPMSAALPRHIQFARSIDWASTPLGPIENWGFDLRAMCNLIMGSPHPAAMYWGDDYTAIYNEAYILLAGQKHPKLMVRYYSSLTYLRMLFETETS